MSYEIRALSFGELLDLGFRLLRDHARLILGPAVGLYLVVGAPMLLLEGGTLTGAPSGMIAGFAVLAGIGLVALLLLYPYLSAVINHALGDVYLGRQVTLRDELRAGARRLLPLVGTWLIASLAFLGGVVFIVAAGVAVAGGLALFQAPGWLSVLVGVIAALLGSIAVLVLMLSLFLILVPVMVLERSFGLYALRRHYALVRGQMLRGFGILTVLFFLNGVLAAGLQLGLGWIPLVGSLVSSVGQGVVLAYGAAVQVLLYFDIRCRKEAFDLEHLARLVEARSEGAGAAGA